MYFLWKNQIWIAEIISIFIKLKSFCFKEKHWRTPLKMFEKFWWKYIKMVHGVWCLEILWNILYKYLDNPRHKNRRRVDLQNRYHQNWLLLMVWCRRGSWFAESNSNSAGDHQKTSNSTWKYNLLEILILYTETTYVFELD